MIVTFAIILSKKYRSRHLDPISPFLALSAGNFNGFVRKKISSQTVSPKKMYLDNPVRNCIIIVSSSIHTFSLGHYNINNNVRGNSSLQKLIPGLFVRIRTIMEEIFYESFRVRTSVYSLETEIMSEFVRNVSRGGNNRDDTI